MPACGDSIRYARIGARRLRGSDCKVPLPDLERGIGRYDHAPNVRVHNKFDELAEEEEMTESPPPPAALTTESMTVRRWRKNASQNREKVRFVTDVCGCPSRV